MGDRYEVDWWRAAGCLLALVVSVGMWALVFATAWWVIDGG